ncbi:MAG: secondary thiamine-phosphate synthase enzyme YjbQ [Terriglobia bacterium]
MGVEIPKRATEQRLSRVIQVETRSRVEFNDVTSTLQQWVEQSGAGEGVCHLFVPHTTAGLLVNENDDRSLATDLDDFLKRLAPAGKGYHHNDGNCDAHLKAALIGCSKTLLIENGRLVLGRWQGVFFCEFDGPRRRELRVKIIPD